MTTPAAWEPQVGDTVHIVNTTLGDFTGHRKTTVERITKTLVITATGDRFKRDNRSSERSLDLYGARPYGYHPLARLFPDGHETVARARASLRLTEARRTATAATQAATRSNATVENVDAALDALHTLRTRLIDANPSHRRERHVMTSTPNK